MNAGEISFAALAVVALLFSCAPSAARIDRADAIARAHAAVSADLKPAAVLYAALAPLPPQSVVDAMGKNPGAPADFGPSWLVFVDDAPSANWEHPCRYIFVDANTGRVAVVAGHLPPRDWNRMEKLTP